jgi:transposase
VSDLQTQLSSLQADLENERNARAEEAKALAEERRLREHLEWKLKDLQAKLFGKSSEKIHPDQLQLILEGLEAEAALDTTPESAVEKDKPRRKSRKKGMQFPDDLPEETIEIDLPESEKICSVTGEPRRFIRWEETTKINYVPGYFRRIKIRRGVYALAPSVQEKSEDLIDAPVITAEMPQAYRVIPGAVAGAGLLAYLLVAKYCDHLPFYRLQQIFKTRHRVQIDRTTMCHWMKRCSELLYILYEALRLELLSGNYLQVDETAVKLLDPDTKGKAKQSYFWVITRPGEGVLYWFGPGRGSEVASELLDGFSGKLQTDGYEVYESLAKRNDDLVHFGCWAHARRKFVESLESGGADAAWYVAEIQRLYRIEARCDEAVMNAEARAEVRGLKSAPVLARIKVRLELDRGSGRILPSSPLGKAMSYTLNRWPSLERYAGEGNGEVRIDNNPVENAIRPSAIGKKNWLFIGHPKAGQRSAIIYTMIEECRLHQVDPLAYLTDVLPRIMDHSSHRIAELLPRQWAEANRGEK